MEKLLLYSWQALGQDEGGAVELMSQLQYGQGNRGGGDGGADGDIDDLLSSKCYLWVWYVSTKLYTFIEYWFFRSLEWKYNFPCILLKGLKT